MSDESKELPPGQTPIRRLLRWGIEHIGVSDQNPKIDLKTYTLLVDGEVDSPVRLSWNEVLRLPKTESISDFHCVEGWSVPNCRWKGIRMKDLMNHVKPNSKAMAATLECADGYTTSLTLNELSGDDVLLAYRLNDQPLEEGYGFPLRLVVPSKYGYKSALWVTHVKFTATKELGYWENRGYSDTAEVWKDDRFSK